MLKNKRNIAIGGVVLVLLISFFVFGNSGGSETTDIIVPVEEGQFIVDINTTGELEAKNSTEITGPNRLRNYRIYQVNIQDIIDEGTYVEKGQYIARLDPSELNNRMKDSELQIEEQQSEYTQVELDTTLQLREARDNLTNLAYAVEEKQLVFEQSQYEPPATIKQAEIEFEKAKRALKQAKEAYLIKQRQLGARMKEVSIDLRQDQLEYDGMKELLSQFTITAPESGMLIYRKGYDGRPIKEGSQISAWDPVVATLPDLSSMNSITYVNEVDIRKVSVGQKVDIGLDAFPDKKLSGVVTRVANVGEQRPNSDAKVFQVTIELDKVDGDLRPGMTTSNKIFTQVIEQAVSIPLEALHSFQDSITYVYKQTGMNYQRQEVQIGATNADRAEILLGLSTSDEVYLSAPNGDIESADEIKLLAELNGKRNLKKEEPKQDTPTPPTGRKGRRNNPNS